MGGFAVGGGCGAGVVAVQASLQGTVWVVACGVVGRGCGVWGVVPGGVGR